MSVGRYRLTGVGSVLAKLPGFGISNSKIVIREFRARGKWRGYSPGAAALHSQSARVKANFLENRNFFPKIRVDHLQGESWKSSRTMGGGDCLCKDASEILLVAII